MKVIILGAGVLGVMSAYYLGARGHEVEVIERQPEAGRETSYANGGQLSYSHAEPWANPFVLKKVFKWMWQEDAPLVLRFNSDPRMIEWGLRFLWNCRRSPTGRHSQALLRLGLYSRDKMQELMADTRLEFDHLKKGILHVYDSQHEFDHACRQAEFQHEHGCDETIMSWEECLKLEPSLAFTSKKIYGGIHAPLDESGDIFSFTQKLAKLCEEKFGAVFHHNTEILSLNDENEEISHVATNRGNMRADAYVMAMGSYSPLLLRPVGIHVPIYPMKGYSVTFPANEYTPTLSITDDALKIVYSRLGQRIRVAGTAEFSGYNTDIRQARIKPILRGIETLFPRADLSEIQEWACLRPSTPDGPPIIGKTRYKNLFLNTGHGTLGWTQGAGSARIVADIMEGHTPEISLDGLTIGRYQ